MIYESFLSKSSKQTVVAESIDEVITAELSSINNLVESFILVNESNLVTIHEADFKALVKRFITKIREILRKIKLKLKDLFKKFYNKALEEYTKEQINKIKELISDEEISDKLHDGITVSIVTGKDAINIYNATLDPAAIDGLKNSGSESDAKLSEENLKKSKERLDKVYKNFVVYHNTSNPNNIKAKVPGIAIEMTFHNEKDVIKTISEPSAIIALNKTTMDKFGRALVSMENALAKLEKGDITSDALNNWRKCYTNNIATIQNYLNIFSQINYFIDVVQRTNIKNIKLALQANQERNDTNRSINDIPSVKKAREELVNKLGKMPALK